MKLMISKAGFMILATLATLTGWAQDSGGKKVDVDVNLGKNDSYWYQQPWVWIIGGAIFILLLVALLRGGDRRVSE